LSKIFNLKFFISLFVILVVLAVSIMLLVFYGNTANVAYVYVDNELVETLYLNEDKTVEIECDNGYNIVCVKNKKVFVSDADCFNHDCVLMGKMNKVNQSIICLPHKMVINLKKVKLGGK